jgi:hypothetical protein
MKFPDGQWTSHSSLGEPTTPASINGDGSIVKPEITNWLRFKSMVRLGLVQVVYCAVVTLWYTVFSLPVWLPQYY